MTQILEKRTFDARLYDFNCAALLATGETIASVSSVTADQGGLTFGGAAINSVAISYPDGSVAPIGTVIQVPISGGMITGGTSLLCTIRCRFVTNTAHSIEATAQLNLTDTVSS